VAALNDVDYPQLIERARQRQHEQELRDSTRFGTAFS